MSWIIQIHINNYGNVPQEFKQIFWQLRDDTHKVAVEGFVELKRAAFVRWEWSGNVITVLGSEICKNRSDAQIIKKNMKTINFLHQHQWAYWYIISCINIHKYIIIVLHCSAMMQRLLYCTHGCRTHCCSRERQEYATVIIFSTTRRSSRWRNMGWYPFILV